MQQDTQVIPPIPAPPGSPRPFLRRLQAVALSLLIIVLAVHLLQLFATVLQQLFIAAFIAYLIMPIHAWLVRRRVPGPLVFPVIALLFLAASFALGQLIYRNVSDLSDNLPVYQKNFTKLMQEATSQVPEPVAHRLGEIFMGEERSLQHRMRVVQSALGTFFEFLSQMVLVLVYLVFILAERVSLTKRLRVGFDGGDAGQAMSVVQRINHSIGKYIAVKTSMSFIGGVLTAVVLLAFGVDYALLWGIVAFLLNFIPYLGSWVAVLLPVALSLVQFESPWYALVILALLLLIQNVIGYAIEPRLAGSRLNLSPLVIILSLAFWGTIWGIVGMILAVPLVVVVKSILENIPQTKPLAVLLSNE